MKSTPLLIALTLFCTVLNLESCQCPLPRGHQKRVIAQEHYEHRTGSNISPNRTIESLDVDFEEEKVVKLSHARVLIADYELLRKDFPVLRELSNPEVDQWLIDQTGYISIPQAQQHVVNTAIPTQNIERSAYRPRRYNRAIIFDAQNPKHLDESMGLLDVKGTGALAPAQKDHGNGVATLGEVIREFIYERVMREVVYDAQIENKIAGSYAVIDPGFDVIHEDGSRSPAGYYIRQGHDRWVSNNSHRNDWLDQTDRDRLQKIFREYGLDPNTNIQGTKNKNIFDFGHFVVRDDMREIDPEKQISFEAWGYDKSIREDRTDRWFYSKRDNPWNWSHELADAWRRGDADRHSVWLHYENMVRPFVQKVEARNLGNQNCVQNVRNVLSP